MRLHGTGLDAAQIFFITGADAFAEIETWNRYTQVLEMANFVVVSRPGYKATALPARLPALAARMYGLSTTVDAQSTPVDQPAAVRIALIDAPTRDVSSTEIRRRLESGLSIADLVPAAVDTYIQQHELYSRHATNARFGRSLA